MSDTSAPVPAGESAGSADSGAAGAADVGAQQASAGGGLAPASGGATDGSLVPGDAPAAAAPSGYAFGGRQFRDQAHAEQWMRSQLGRFPETQRQLAEFQRQNAELSARLEALQSAFASNYAPGPPNAQGVGQGSSTSPSSVGFADELVKSGDLQFIADLAEEKGLAHAIYALADRFDQRQRALLGELEDGIMEQAVLPMQRHTEFSTHMSSMMGAARQLAQEYPELNEQDQSPEAQEAQGAIAEILKELSPEWTLQNPHRALRIAVEEYRRQNGTPGFAFQPGTSASPSARAALASELAQASVSPLSGQGVPRPRPNGVPESDAERIRRENRAASNVLKSPSGRSLGFSP